MDFIIKKTKEKFEKAMDDDLDINKALAVVFNFVREINRRIDLQKLDRTGAKQVIDFMNDLDRALGILEHIQQATPEHLPSNIEEMIEKREKAREVKDWKTADLIRQKLDEMDILLEDTPEGVRWKRRLRPD